MSTLWTPGGERPIRRDPQPTDAGQVARGQATPGQTTPGQTTPGHVAPGQVGPEPGAGEPTEAEMAELTEQLARTPAEVVIVNHAYGLFELARLYLALQPPLLDQARMTIDALGYLVEGMGDRLGPPAGDLSTALSQLRIAYVQIQGAMRAGASGPGSGTPPDPAS